VSFINYLLGVTAQLSGIFFSLQQYKICRQAVRNKNKNLIFLILLYPIRYIYNMNIIKKTEKFEKWFKKLHNISAKGKILSRLKRAELGNLGDVKTICAGLFEMRIDCGPGYRIYFTKKEEVIILLLVGGDKSTQDKNIKQAQHVLSELGGWNG
jgi:putative addiction module killer protein